MNGTHVTPEVGGTADSDGARDRDWDREDPFLRPL